MKLYEANKKYIKFSLYRPLKQCSSNSHQQ